jgi:hypothetical protein
MHEMYLCFSIAGWCAAAVFLLIVVAGARRKRNS